MAAESGFSVTTADGFAVESNPRGGMIYRRNGEDWPPPGKSHEIVRLVESLAKEIERLRGDAQAVVTPSREAITKLVCCGAKGCVLDSADCVCLAMDPQYGNTETADAILSLVLSTDPLAGLDERLDRLLLTANDNSRFVLSTESAKNIVGIVREWLRVKAVAGNEGGGPA